MNYNKHKKEQILNFLTKSVRQDKQGIADDTNAFAIQSRRKCKV